ncbi:hypothetical protein SKAU_G00240250 [Synaphobranchus kaupii]|uniref:Uncharacterized protein n=1 Tax=Synaphobranchus kaupii TaxID=118154 RepID=A0A9Q1F7F0_SYNKA|nr:hypothetical protein SKAU_G00240250 [Synaphobranchus kaupii]
MLGFIERSISSGALILSRFTVGYTHLPNRNIASLSAHEARRISRRISRQQQLPPKTPLPPPGGGARERRATQINRLKEQRLFLPGLSSSRQVPPRHLRVTPAGSPGWELKSSAPAEMLRAAEGKPPRWSLAVLPVPAGGTRSVTGPVCSCPGPAAARHREGQLPPISTRKQAN